MNFYKYNILVDFCLIHIVREAFYSTSDKNS